MEKSCFNCHYYDAKSRRCWCHSIDINYYTANICDAYYTADAEDCADELCKENLALKKRLEELESRVKSLKQDADRYHNEQLENRSRIASLERDLMVTREENESLTKRNACLDKRIEGLLESVEAKEEALDHLINECNHLRDKNLELEIELDKKNDEFDNLQKKHDGLIEDNNNFMSKIQYLKHERVVEKDEKARLEDENLELKSKIKELMEKLACKPLSDAMRPWIKTKFPNLDCPVYAARVKAKYDSLIKVGFTEDQAISLLPLWWDEEV